ncbi:MAG: HAD-IA family hydrolase [Dehalococcoidia bacterium]|nr:HAD-IA family hydrolase [Dehalococcoidia bacterium]
MIKTVFFDLYHTLICFDPPREDNLSAILGRDGHVLPPERLRRVLVAADEFYNRETARLPLSGRDRAGVISFWKDYYAVALEKVGVAPAPELLDHIIAGMSVVKYGLALFGDVLPALEALAARRIPLGVISNINSDIAPLLDSMGVLSFFSLCLTSKEAGAIKPDPAIFRLGAERMGVAPEDALYVGDQWEADVLGARGAGMQALLIDRGCCFTDVPAVDRLSSLEELSGRI